MILWVIYLLSDVKIRLNKMTVYLSSFVLKFKSL